MLFSWNSIAELCLSWAWLVVLLLLTFCVWKRVRHWSIRVLLYSVASMVLLRMAFMAEIAFLMIDSHGDAEMEFEKIVHVYRDVMYFGRLLAYAGGIAGGIGALVALRKNKWSVQAMRSATEAAQPIKGGA